MNPSKAFQKRLEALDYPKSIHPWCLYGVLIQQTSPTHFCQPNAEHSSLPTVTAQNLWNAAPALRETSKPAQENLHLCTPGKGPSHF